MAYPPGRFIVNWSRDEFIELIDTPDSYSRQSGKIVIVNPAETALQFATTGSPVPSKTVGNYTLYIWEDAMGLGDGSTKANAFITIQDALDSCTDIIQGIITLIVCKGSTDYAGQQILIQKIVQRVDSQISGRIIIRGEYSWNATCDANTTPGKIIDASADFSDVEIGDRIYCKKLEDLYVKDFCYGTVTEFGTGYVQTSETTKIPTTGWTYDIIKTVLDATGVHDADFISVLDNCWVRWSGLAFVGGNYADNVYSLINNDYNAISWFWNCFFECSGSINGIIQGTSGYIDMFYCAAVSTGAHQSSFYSNDYIVARQSCFRNVVITPYGGGGGAFWYCYFDNTSISYNYAIQTSWGVTSVDLTGCYITENVGIGIVGHSVNWDEGTINNAIIPYDLDVETRSVEWWNGYEMPTSPTVDSILGYDYSDSSFVFYNYSAFATVTHGSKHVSTGSDPIPNVVAAGASGLMSGVDKTKLDTLVNPMILKGSINCSTDPTYPAATIGDVYRVSVSGRIGGAAGPVVQVGDTLICYVTSPSGTHADVGANWNIEQANIDGAVIGPSSSVGNNFVSFSGSSGRLVKDSGVNSSSFLGANATAVNSELLDNMDSTAFATTLHNHDLTYLGLNAKAADADLLDGMDSTDFATTLHNHDLIYLGINDTASNSDLLDGMDSTEFATTLHNHDLIYLGINDTASNSELLDGMNSTEFATVLHTHTFDDIIDSGMVRVMSSSDEPGYLEDKIKFPTDTFDTLIQYIGSPVSETMWVDIKANVFATYLHNHDLTYLGISAKASDSDLLDGMDSTAFATTLHNHDLTYLGISAKSADSELLDGQDSAYFATSTHNHDLTYLGISAKAADANLLDGMDSTAFATVGDSRLTDARTPTAHNNTYHTATYITTSGVTYEALNSNGDVGTTSGTLCAGDDSRLTDSRTPTYHTQMATTIELLELGTATYDDTQDWLNITQSGGRISGGALTEHTPANGTLDISAMKCFVKITDSDIAETRYFDMASQTGIALTDNNINYIYVDYNAGTPRVLVTTDRTTIRQTDQFNLGRAFCAGTDVEVLISGINTYNRTRKVHERWIDTFGGLSYANGLIVSCTGLKPAFNAGTLYAGSNKIHIDALDCNVSGTFDRYYYNPTTLAWVITAGQTTLSNSQYNKTDTGTGLASLSTNRYAVHWLYVCPEGEMYVLMGQGDYTLAQAQALSTPILIPNYLSQWAKLAAKIIIARNSATVYSITMAWSTQFPVQNAGDHNDLVGLQGGTTDQYYHLTASEQTDLSAIAAVADSVGLLKKTAANTWTIDTNTYLTGNQSISITGDITGSGTTSISTTLASSGVSIGTYKSVTVDVNGRVTGGTNPTTLSGYGITDAVSSSWTEVTGLTQAMAVNTNYIANNANLVTLTLPATAAVGNTISLAGSGVGGWKIAQNASQQIVFGSKLTTAGTGGYMYSNSQYESLTLLCIVANTTFSVIRPTGEPWMV